MAQRPDIDTVLLACTHFPLLYDKIRAAIPQEVNVVCQGEIVADSLADYLSRHPEMESRLRLGGRCRYLTTENSEAFSALACVFMGQKIDAEHIDL